MGMSPTKINFMRQRDFIHVSQMGGQDAGASVGAGVPVMAEISTFGIVGCLMAFAGDDIAHVMAIPTNWARNQPIRVRAIWECAAAAVGARDITWKFLYSLITPDTTALIVPATALDTAIAVDVPLGTANTVQRSPAGIINANTIGDTVLYMSFLMEMDAFHADLSEDKHLLGVEFEYTVRMGHGKPLEGPAWSHAEA
jgi:hypothetical protein